MRRRLLILAVFISTVCALTSGWAFYRTQYIVDINTNATFPHPDAILLSLEEWLDHRNPLPPEYIKMHGEWPRLSGYFFIAFLLAIGAMLLSSGLLWIRPLTRRCS